MGWDSYNLLEVGEWASGPDCSISSVWSGQWLDCSGLGWQPLTFCKILVGTSDQGFVPYAQVQTSAGPLLYLFPMVSTLNDITPSGL